VTWLKILLNTLWVFALGAVVIYSQIRIRSYVLNRLINSGKAKPKRGRQYWFYLNVTLDIILIFVLWYFMAIRPYVHI
jgi:hypothetical protein